MEGRRVKHASCILKSFSPAPVRFWLLPEVLSGQVTGAVWFPISGPNRRRMFTRVAQSGFRKGAGFQKDSQNGPMDKTQRPIIFPGARLSIKSVKTPYGAKEVISVITKNRPVSETQSKLNDKKLMNADHLSDDDITNWMSRRIGR